MPTESGKDKFFAELETLIAKAKRLQTSGFYGVTEDEIKIVKSAAK